MWARALGIALVIVASSTALLATHGRAWVWTNEGGLWADAHAKAPLKPRPLTNLGRYYHLQRRHDLAAQYYEQARRAARSPRYTAYEQHIGQGLAEANLAILKFERGDRDGALALTRAALDRSPDPAIVQSLHLWFESQPSSPAFSR